MNAARDSVLVGGWAWGPSRDYSRRRYQAVPVMVQLYQ